MKHSNFKEMKNNDKTNPEAIYEETEKQASSAYEKIKNKADCMGEQIKEKAEHVYESGKEAAQDVKDYISEYCPEKLVKFIKKQPLTAVLIAGGIGMALSLCMKK